VGLSTGCRAHRRALIKINAEMGLVESIAENPWHGTESFDPFFQTIGN
jgi:hypothetical protein